MRSTSAIAVAVLAATVMTQSPAWAAVTFASPANYAAGDAPQSVAIADLNGDGRPDLAVANLTSGNVSVLLGNGDGTFTSATNYSAGSGSASVAVGDFNGDDKPDLAVANNFSGDVSVLLGNGDGTFTSATNYATGAASSSVAVADLNGDDKPDLAVANFGSDDVSVLLGNGDGTFNAAVNYGASNGADSVAIADLNGDDKPDLAVANLVSDSVSVLLGNGDGTFAAAVNQAVGSGPASVAIADLDGDGHPDLATANSFVNGVSVLRGNGDGTFAAAVNYPVGTGPNGLAIADIDGDGNPDLATANRSSDTVSVLRGNGDGTFAAAADVATHSAPTSVGMADLNGDNRPDLATPNANSSDVSVLLQGNSTFDTGPTATISGTPQQGQTLTAHEGSPDPTPDSFSYKWFADGTEIAGQTAKTLLLDSAQVGKRISVEVTAQKAGFDDASDTSAETSAVVGIFNPGPRATISGTQRVGSTLTAGTGSPSPTPTSYAYQWYVDGHPITGANAKTFFLGASFAGKQLQVRVYAIKAGYLTASSLSALTSHISNLQAKTISLELNDYTVKRGQRVYANLDELAPRESWSIVLDGKRLASGTADSQGFAKTSFVIPTNATLGTRTIYGYGAFPDRVDPDRITIR